VLAKPAYDSASTKEKAPLWPNGDGRTKRVGLELVFQGELDLPVVRRGTGDARSSWLIHSVARQAEIGVVQHVEELGAELDLVSFTQVEALLQNKIHADKLRAAQVSNPRVAEHVRDLLSGGQRRHNEYGLVIPTRQRLVAGIIATQTRLLGRPSRKLVRIADLVRPITPTSGVAKITGHAGRECLAALRTRYSTDLPSADNPLGNTAEITYEMSASANR